VRSYMYRWQAWLWKSVDKLLVGAT
jgi:hypothetical protein